MLLCKSFRAINTFGSVKAAPKLTNTRNAAILPVVYFFYPETRYRSLEEMDDIFKKSSSVFNVVSVSLRQPHRYDEHGQLKEEYLEAIEYHENAQGIKSIKASEYLP